MANANSIILVILGFLPSLIWLGFYYRKDAHPEPKYLVSKTFFMGLILAPLAIIAQYLFREGALYFNTAYNYSESYSFFLWAAFVEEAVKFLAVKFLVLHDPEFDEPTDAMIYMIAAGLGFAAIENVLVLFQAIPNGIQATASIWLLRFVGATLLHAVSSAVTGYFLALAWFYSHHSRKLIALGLALATLLHFMFNILLLGGGADSSGFLLSTVFLIIIAVLISVLFKKLKARQA